MHLPIIALITYLLSFVVSVPASNKNEWRPMETDSPFVSPEEPKLLSRKLYAIGDLHGDLQTTLQILEMAGIISNDRKWIASDSILVQTGDIVDRGPDSIEIYHFFYLLKFEAEAVGGSVVSLLGNHELMNMMGDMAKFGNESNRIFQFSTQGQLGAYLRTLDIAKQLYGTVFVHGGIRKEIIDMFGSIEGINAVSKGLMNREKIPDSHMLFDAKGPLWYRSFALKDNEKTCIKLAEVLLMLGAQRMVVGHTTQWEGEILAKCNTSLTQGGLVEPRLYVIDIGISKFYKVQQKGLLEMVIEDEMVVAINGFYNSKRVSYFDISK